MVKCTYLPGNTSCSLPKPYLPRSSPQGFSASQVQVERFLNLRYTGTDVAVMTPCPAPGSGSSYAEAFAASYRREYGFTLDRPVVVDDVRVRAVGRSAELPAAGGEVQAAGEGPGGGLATYAIGCLDVVM